jgi:fumarate reductase flavoprotein subunit
VKETTMQRRSLLQIASASALLGPLAALAARHETADIVVIGSGGTGLTTALTAFDAGARVIVLEKMPITGGNTQLAAGGMNAAPTRFQAAKGIKDSLKIMYDDTYNGGQKLGNPELVDILVRDSAGSVEFLTGLGADLTDVGRMGGASVNRCHRPTGGDAVGHHIVHVLRQSAIKRKLDVRTNARVVKIFKAPNGRVTGVLVANKRGELYSIEAPVIVLASGGFSSDLARVARYRPEYAGYSSTNQPGATGDGIDLAVELGAQLIGMKEIQIHPTQAAGSKILITEAVRGNGAILVNRRGERFVNELTTRDACSAAILRQPGGTAFLVLDDAIRRSLKQIEGYFHLELAREGATPEALARAIGAEPTTLAATLNTYNQAQAAKVDGAFKRTDMPRPISKPGYVAIEVRPGIHYTMGGVAIDPRTRVLASDGQVLAGVFAAGEVTGGVHGANRLGGNSISETVTFGRIAGREAVAYAKAMRSLKTLG